MQDLIPAEFVDIATKGALPLLLVVVLLSWLIIRRRMQQQLTFQSVCRTIAFEHLKDVIVPNADDGEIQIDHLLLTSKGLLIVDVKSVQGNVFGSNKMQDWTVIGDNNRFTFPNPQPALYDRIAAVRQIVQQVPVSGRVLFLDGARFTKGVPDLVSSLEQLRDEFGETDKAAADAKIDAFRPHWEKVRAEAA